ncbi:MAG: hypothetical protein QXP29_07900 [Candidatus Nezhaarchaeales archaeon]
MSRSVKVRISRVYLNVETYRPEKELDFIREDIILIGCCQMRVRRESLCSQGL